MSCPPRLSIDSENISQLNKTGVAESIAIDIAFNSNSQTLTAVHSASLIKWIDAPNNEPNYLHFWTLQHAENFQFWDIETSQSYADLLKVSYSAFPDLAATGDGLGNITFWDAEEQIQLQTMHETEIPITDIVFHPKEKWLVAVHGSSQIGIYAPDNPDVVWLPLATDEAISNIAFNISGELLAIGMENSVQVWSSAELAPLASTAINSNLYKVLSHPQQPETFFTVSDTSISEFTWNNDDKQLELTSTFEKPSLMGNRVTSATINHDGSVMILIINDVEIFAWDTQLGQVIDVPVFELPVFPENDIRPIYDAAFSPDGLWLVVGSGYGLSFFVVP